MRNRQRKPNRRRGPHSGPRSIYGVCAALVLLAWTAAPAVAQERRWPDDLDRTIEAQIEQHIEIATREIERFFDQDFEDALNEVHRAINKQAYKVQRKVAVAVQRQSGEAAQRVREAQQRAAQRARDAERRRRDENRRGPEYTDQISRTLRLGRNGTVDIQNLSGDITVAGGSANDVRIEATKRVRHQNESEARELLRAIDVRIDERNGDVEVRTDYPRRNWSGGVDYNVSVPRDANVILRSISGDIRVSNLNGELRAETTSGDLTATSVRRIRQAKTISGDLEISDSDGDEVAASTVSGDIEMRAIKARTVDLQAVSGDMRITDVESDRLFGRSVSGTVEFSGRLARNGRYELQSHSGNVRVSPIGSTGFTIEASTFSGNLQSDFPVTLQGNSPNRFGPGRSSPVRGSFGDGSALLSLQSFSGNITITKR
jgi:DUF4097 and DUF4098 domain-containing protein YvlB